MHDLAYFVSALKRAKIEHILLVFVLCVAAWFAYIHQFIQDDAFISFRYAKNFAEGKGLVWYPGSDEYGYTNFLFTLLTGLLMKLGIGVPAAAFFISVPAYFGSIVVTFLIGRHISNTLWVPFFATMALATHLTFSAYATGGLETSLQTFFVLAAYYQFFLGIDSVQRRSLVLLGIFSALALLTRLDSALLLYPAYVILLVQVIERWQAKGQDAKETVQNFIAACAIPTGTVLLLMLFCYLYYGYPLPNTFYIKIDSVWYLENGREFFTSYLKTQAYTPLILLGIWLYIKSGRPLKYWRHTIILLLPVTMWAIYILHIGGDFMEYRLLVPVLPFFYLMVFEGILNGKATGRKCVGLGALLLVAALVHGRGYYYLPDLRPNTFSVVTLKMLQMQIGDKPNNWITVGQKLHKLFYTGQPDDVKIATTAIGAIGYYSELPAVDQLGLNTRDIVIHGKPYTNRPGHRTKITTEYMRAQGVNLVIDHPLYVNRPRLCNDLPRWPYHENVPLSPMVFIPIDGGRFLLAYYLTPHPRVEELLVNKRIFSCITK